MPGWTLIPNSTSRFCDASCRRSRRPLSKAARYRQKPLIRSGRHTTAWPSKPCFRRSEQLQPALPTCALSRSWRRQIDSRRSQGFALCTMLIMKAVKSHNALSGHAFACCTLSLFRLKLRNLCKPLRRERHDSGRIDGKVAIVCEPLQYTKRGVPALCIGIGRRHAATCELEGRRAGRSAGKSAAVIGCLSFLASFTNAGTRHAGT